MNLAEAFERIAGTRRSVYPKDYLPGKVEDEVVMKMLELADRAPTHKRTEPWRFIVFSGEGLRKLAEFQAACYKKVTEANGTYKEDRYQNLLVKPMESSHIIAVGMKRDAASGLPEWEELGAVFCAVENIYLAATAFGIGCYLSTGGITNFEEAKEFFGLGPQDRLCGFIHIGRTAIYESALPQSPRKPLNEKMKWIS
ncbi:MAG: nitroreductase family protein [Cyclobacteriaceae bacterium]